MKIDEFEVVKKDVKKNYCYFAVVNNRNYGITRVKVGEMLNKNNINYSVDRETAMKKYNHAKMYK